MATTYPLDFQSELDSIGAQRALINALRQHEGEGERYPGFSQATAGIGRAIFGDPLAKLAAQEKQAAHDFESRRASATQDILEMSPMFSKPAPVLGEPMGPPDAGGAMSQPSTQGEWTPQEVSARASRGMSAGVPQELINSALQNRQADWMMQSIDSGALPSQQVGGGAPQQGGPQGTPQGGAGGPPPQQGGGGFMPFTQQPQGGQPDETASAISHAMQPHPTGTALQNVPMGKLITMGAMMPPGNAMGALIAAEIKARAPTMDNGMLVQGNTPVGRFDRNGTFTDLQTGKTYDPSGKLLAARAGGVAGAEAQAKAPFTPIQTKEGNIDATTFAPQIPGFGQQAPGMQPQQAPQGMPPSGRTADFNLKGATQAQAMAAVQAAYGGGQPQEAPPGMPPATGGQQRQPVLGRGADPIAQKAALEEAGNRGADLGKLNDSIVGAADVAQTSQARLDDIKKLIPIIPFGKMGDFRQTAAEYALDGPSATKGLANLAVPNAAQVVPAMQIFGKMAGNMVIEQAKQLGTREAASVIQMVSKLNPNITWTQPAAQAVVDYLTGANKWAVDRATAAQGWYQKNGSLEGFQTTWNNSHPMSSYIPPIEILDSAFKDGTVPELKQASGMEHPPAINALLMKYAPK